MSSFDDLPEEEQDTLARLHLSVRQYGIWQAYMLHEMSVYAYAEQIGRPAPTVYRWLLQARDILEAEARDLEAVRKTGYPITFNVVSGGGTTRMNMDKTLRRACPSLLPPKKKTG